MRHKHKMVWFCYWTCTIGYCKKCKYIFYIKHPEFKLKDPFKNPYTPWYRYGSRICELSNYIKRVDIA